MAGVFCRSKDNDELARDLDSDLYDVMGLFTGSEGLLGVITQVTVRILAKPQSAWSVDGFPTVEAAGGCVAAIIANGSIPAGLEMMHRASINAVEDFEVCAYPRDMGSLLICELDGPRGEVDDLVQKVSVIADGGGESLVRTSNSEGERLRFWKGRKPLEIHDDVATRRSSDFSIEGRVPGTLAPWSAESGRSRPSFRDDAAHPSGALPACNDIPPVCTPVGPPRGDVDPPVIFRREIADRQSHAKDGPMINPG